MPQAWGAYIDLEGFSSLLQEQAVRALLPLKELMRAVFRIGRRCYPNDSERLFAYQFGDGFIVSSEFPEASLDRPVAISIAVLRHVASFGGYARAAIAEGDMADIQGCYPDEVMSQCSEGHRVMLGDGIMTITTVMGTALTEAVHLSGRGKPDSSGPLLLIRTEDDPRVDPAIPRATIPDTNLSAVDWVHAKSELIESIQTRSELCQPSAAELEAGLADYCRENSLSKIWMANVRAFLHIELHHEGA